MLLIGTMCRTKVARSASGGFLLVEALATMAISAFLLVAMASVVSLMLRASERTQRTSQDIEETSRTLAMLMREIGQITPVRWAGPGAGFAFEGTSDRLSFARVMQMPDDYSEIRMVTLHSERGRLTQEERALTPTAGGLADLDPTLTQDVVQQRFSIRFAYFSRLDTGQEALTDTWGDSFLLPLAVRVSLIDRDGSSRSVRVPILVDAEPGCAAPDKAVCSFVRGKLPNEVLEPDEETPIDPDDKLGWLRYLNR